ncbi:hypothetical protein [Ruminococcus albus]|uniref:Uncharacterized protein n=1 Tax=Ruminococcus albus TaxID=1264 RepID=A0A1H7MZG8_RUMAL|nr:hypothetical protein [Ruminococcus albus]SEL16584.1 hypothetical protein SAMN05216469_11346 [Ruminococcus albus]
MNNTNRKALAMRIIAVFMLIMGIIGTARGSTAAIACLCSSASMVAASNWIVRRSR